MGNLLSKLVSKQYESISFFGPLTCSVTSKRQRCTYLNIHFMDYFSAAVFSDQGVSKCLCFIRRGKLVHDAVVFQGKRGREAHIKTYALRNESAAHNVEASPFFTHSGR